MSSVDFDLRVGQTGIRPGELVTSAVGAKQTKGIVMEILGYFPTDHERIEQLSVTDIRDKLNVVPFFASMSLDQRKEWLLSHSDSRKDLYLEDVDLPVKFHKIDGKNFFTDKLSKEQIALLLKGNPDTADGSWSIQQVYNMFPRKPGSKARRHTLIFRPGNWRLMIIKKDVDSYNGVYMDFDDLQLKSGYIEKPPQGLLRVIDMSDQRLPQIGIFSSTPSQELNLDDMAELLQPWIKQDDFKTVKQILDWFPPSLHKSLIQKIIRTRAETTSFNNVEYPAIIPLLISFAMLMVHPGVFVPNIQRFVTGGESAMKRLAVTICEDSYTEDFDGLISLYAGALMKQRYKDWNPPKHAILKWIHMAVSSQEDHRLFAYDFRQFNNVILGINSLSASYFLLQETKSFHSDVKMVGSIAQNQGVSRNTNGLSARIKSMPLVHCVDHHSFGEIAHFMPYPTSPYPELFRDIWQKVVGVNPRTMEYQNMENDPFTQATRRAQANLWTSKMHWPQPRPIPDSTVLANFSYVLDESWISGLIGPIEVRLRSGVAMVVLRVDDITAMTAVKRPSRDKSTSSILTEDEESTAIRLATEYLEKGIKLQNVPSTLSIFKDAIVHLKNNVYLVTIQHEGEIKSIPWDIIRRMEYKFQVHSTMTIENPINNAILHTGDGVDAESTQKIQHLLSITDLKVLRRLIVYLTGNRSTLELHRVSRDGSGTYYQVLPEDTGVYHFLCAVAIIYPAALRVTKKGFDVSNGPLLWAVRDNISRFVSSRVTFGSGWTLSENRTIIDIRKRWEHQNSSLRQMKTRHQAGKRGHLIWIEVGMGKTMIALDYIDYLISLKQMPQYCVYTLPPSAIDNTIKEIEMKGLPHRLIDARKPAMKKGHNILHPCVINIVRHDHMILNGMDDQLKSIANECFFIVDEFHKTLAKTKRTSIALEMTRLSYDFVGMSGTIVKDTDTDELIEWLEQIVEFEVTKNNYWVAIGALVSRKVQTHVVVDRRLDEIPMPDDHKQQYYDLVPEKMGGRANHIKFNEALNLSYQVVTEIMIDTTKQYVDMGEGVFVVAKNIAHQQEIQTGLLRKGMSAESISLLGKDNQVTLTPEYNGPIKVVITTITYNAGYTLTKFRVMIQSEYPSNQATRDQLEGRINRIGQISPNILVITIVTGILTYIHEHHEKARNLSQALKGFAKDAGIDYKEITF